MTCPSDRAERAQVGSATILVIAAILLISALTAVVLVVLTLISTQGRASQAADLAALAGAERAWFGQDSACQEAARIASAHGATVERCTVQSLDVQVHVVITVPATPVRALAADGPLELRAVARAGPPSDLRP